MGGYPHNPDHWPHTDGADRTLRIVVNPCDRGRRVKVEDRIEIAWLTPAAAQGLAVAEQGADSAAKSDGMAARAGIE
jgi:hypothetical protein